MVLGLLVQVAVSTVGQMVAAPAAAAGPTIVSQGYLPGDATWGPEGSPYVIDGTVSVGAGTTLTILPGTVVKFVPAADPGVTNFNDVIKVLGGRLVADGTPANPIVLTSYFDDSVAGDTDGGGRGPSRGDWRGITIAASGLQTDAEVSAVPASVFDNVSFRWGGSGTGGACSSGEVLEIDGRGRARVSRSEFVDFERTGVQITGTNRELGIAAVTNTRFARGGSCGVSVINNGAGELIGNIFEPTAGMWGLYAGGSRGARVVGNWFYVQVQAFDSYGMSRAQLDVRDNAFLLGYDSSPTTANQQLQDWRFNWWGRPLPKQAQGCYSYNVEYVPPVAYEFRDDVCGPGGGSYITGYVHDVIPALGEAPAIPQAGIGAQPNVPTGLSMPAEQTLGSGCDPCADNPTESYGYPVNTATGNETKVSVDAQLGGAGSVFRLLRSYNSLSTNVGALGRGWNHNYEAQLDLNDPDRAVYVGVDGQQAGYNRDGGMFDPDPGVRAELTAIAGGYRLTQPDLSRLEFDSSGLLVGLADRSGMGVSLSYAAGRLASVTDAAGRTVAYTHDAATGRLTKVDLPDGRYVEFGYTGDLLTSVRDLRGNTTTYGYDAEGRLAEATDPRGASVTNTYDGATGRVATQTDPRGETTTFTWDPAAGGGAGTSTTTMPDGGRWVERYEGNVLVEQTDPLGYGTEYFYDSDLNVIKVVDGRGFATSMTHDARGNVLSRSGPPESGVTESWTYDAADQPLSHVDANGALTEYVYDAAGRVVGVWQPDGKAVDLTYTAAGQVDTLTSAGGRTVDYDYDAAGNRTAQRLPSGAKTRFGYDPAGRVTSVIDPRGNVTGAVAEDYTTHYTYNAADQVTGVTDARDEVTSSTYEPGGLVDTVTDASGGVTDADYDPAGNLVPVTDPAGASEFGYDDAGNLTSLTDAMGEVTTFDYDLAGQRTATVTARGNEPGADPDAFRWAYRYDRAGNPTGVVDPAGRETTTGFDSLGRATSVSTPADRLTRYGYDGVGNLLTVTDALGQVTSYGYDVMRRVVSHALPGQSATTFGYDADGNRTRQTSPSGTSVTTWTYDADGQLSSEVAPRGNVAGVDPDLFRTSYGYDPAGQLATVSDPFGHVTGFGYDAVGNQTSVVDARGNETANAYDELNRLMSVTNAEGAVTGYGYDSAGDLVSRTDAKNHVTAYGYNARHQITSIIDPLGRKQTFGYDPEGNLVEKVTARGHVSGDPADIAAWTITQAFDARGLRTAVTTADPASSATYRYDADGRMDQMVDATGSTGLGYDDAGRLTSLTHPQGDYAYTYEPYGAVKSRTYPAGGTINYGHDGDGQISDLTANGLTTEFGYTPDGQLNRIDYPTNIEMTQIRGYDRTGRLNEVRNKATGASTPLTRFQYTRDEVGNPVEVLRTRGTTTYTEAFGYDATDRLTRHCEDTTTCAGATAYTSYGYDDVGNRTATTRVGIPGAGTTTDTHDAADQLTARTSPTGTDTYSYDADGQMLTGARSWDPLGRMTDRGNTSYGYDGMGQRRTVTTINGVKELTWDINNPLPMLAVETRADDSTWAQRYTPDGWALGTEHPGQATTRSSFYHDGLGSVTDITGGNGTPTWRYSYDPFGDATETTRLLPAAAVPRMRYTSAYLDGAEYHLRARDYIPDLARFHAPDPLAPSIADPYVSTHAYVGNQPTVYTDPSGLRRALTSGGHGVGCVGDDCFIPSESNIGSEPNRVFAFFAAANAAARVNVTRAFHLGREMPLKPYLVSGHEVYLNPEGPTYGQASKSIYDITIGDCIEACSASPGSPECLAEVAMLSPWGKPGKAIKPTKNAFNWAKKTFDSWRSGGKAAKSSDDAFHYTSRGAAEAIEKQGLRPGSYGTPNGSLSPLQAQIDLALRPNRGLPDALVRVDLAGLRKAGYEIPDATRVGRSFGMPGGGAEMRFPYAIPPQFIKVIPR